MDMRTMPPIINSASSASVTGSAPQLGAMVPGTTGGMPAVSGLSVTRNPMAQQLQSYGRGDDKMLVHMTPGEVGGLQQLAMAHGGSLTINPHTGLPEAGWLGKLLPTILGAALAATGVGAPAAALMVGAGQTALTGSLSKGFMAGLGAFGGAGLAGAAGVGGSLLGGNAGGLLGNNPGLFGAEMGFGAGAKTAASAIPGAGVGEAIKVTGQIPGAGALSAAAPEALTPAIQSAVQGPLSSQIANQAVNQAASNIGQVATQGLAQGAGQATANALPSGGLFSKFGGYTKQGLGGAPKILSKNAPMLAGIGALSSVAGAMQPDMPTYNEDEDDYKFEYKGPFVPGKREVSFQSDEDMRSSGGAEGTFFTPSNPPPRPVSELTPEERAKYGYAEGGIANLPASADFKAAMDYFNASSPGAITASKDPTTPKQIDTREAVHSFNRQPSAPPIMGGGGGGAGGGFNGYNLSDLSGLDVNDFLGQYGYTKNTPIAGKDIASVIDNPAISSPGSMPDFGAPNIMDFGSLGRDSFETGFRPEMLNIQSPEDNYPQYSAPDMQDFQYTPPSMQDFQYTPPSMEEAKYTPPSMQDFQYTPPSMQDFEYTPPSMQDFEYTPPSMQDFQQYTPPSMQDLQQDFQQYSPPAMQEAQYSPPSVQDFQQYAPQEAQYSPPAMQDFQQYSPPSMQDFQQYAPPAMQEAQYSPPSMQDFQQEIQQYAPPSMQEAQYAPSSLYEEMNFGIPDSFSNNRNDEYAQYDALGEFARGGEVDMRNGSFVVDARTVSELGNGSSNAGMELLSRRGGRPLRGPGDGVSDSIRARIGGKQEARVARDEVLFSPEAVRRLGKGSDKRGTAKLYALMNKAHKARKKAKRGQDTKVRKGLA